MDCFRQDQQKNGSWVFALYHRGGRPGLIPLGLASLGYSVGILRTEGPVRDEFKDHG